MCVCTPSASGPRQGRCVRTPLTMSRAPPHALAASRARHRPNPREAPVISTSCRPPVLAAIPVGASVCIIFCVLLGSSSATRSLQLAWAVGEEMMRMRAPSLERRQARNQAQVLTHSRTHSTHTRTHAQASAVMRPTSAPSSRLAPAESRRVGCLSLVLLALALLLGRAPGTYKKRSGGQGIPWLMLQSHAHDAIRIPPLVD